MEPAPPASQEVSQREIEEKIKATMARLSGGGKKKRQKLRRDNRERLRGRQEERDAEMMTDKLQVTEFISVQELANMMETQRAYEMNSKAISTTDKMLEYLTQRIG